jgi:hypothetical protein
VEKMALRAGANLGTMVKALLRHGLASPIHRLTHAPSTFAVEKRCTKPDAKVRMMMKSSRWQTLTSAIHRLAQRPSTFAVEIHASTLLQKYAR